MKKPAIAFLISFIFLTVSPQNVLAHCQVPCGIFDDQARVKELAEHATTIEKAAKEIRELAEKKDAQSANQLVRWVNTKEAHAAKIIETVSEYFLAQRVKAPQIQVTGAGNKVKNLYTEKLVAHHLIIVAAMKAKQSTEPSVIDALKAATAKLGIYYKHDHK